MNDDTRCRDCADNDGFCGNASGPIPCDPRLRGPFHALSTSLAAADAELQKKQAALEWLAGGSDSVTRATIERLSTALAAAEARAEKAESDYAKQAATLGVINSQITKLEADLDAAESERDEAVKALEGMMDLDYFLDDPRVDPALERARDTLSRLAKEPT